MATASETGIFAAGSGTNRVLETATWISAWNESRSETAIAERGFVSGLGMMIAVVETANDFCCGRDSAGGRLKTGRIMTMPLVLVRVLEALLLEQR
jgi:hypothetical protein